MFYKFWRLCRIQDLRVSTNLHRRIYCTEKKSSKAQQISNITKAWMTDLPSDSQYVRTLRFHYVQNGVKKSWDLVKTFDGVLILIFNVTRQKLVFVRQFRPAVYEAIVSGDSKKVLCEPVDIEKYPPEMGVSLELCAGMVDKHKSLEDIAREEVLEECGYNVPTINLEHVFTYRSGIGASSARQTLFYCEVSDDHKISDGGGIHSELIEVVEFSLDDAREIIKQGTFTTSPPGLIMGIMWFFMNKAPTQSC